MKKGSYLINALSHTTILPIPLATYLSFYVNDGLDVDKYPPSLIFIDYTQTYGKPCFYSEARNLIDPQHKPYLHKSGWSAHDSSSSIYPFCY